MCTNPSVHHVPAHPSTMSPVFTLPGREGNIRCATRHVTFICDCEDTQSLITDAFPFHEMGAKTASLQFLMSRGFAGRMHGAQVGGSAAAYHFRAGYSNNSRY